MRKANVFFKVTGLAHVEVEFDKEPDVDGLAWIQFGELMSVMPDGIAFDSAQISIITPEEGKGKKKEDESESDENDDGGLGNYI